VFALLTPLVLLAAVEGILRVTWRSAGLPLFVPMTLERGDALVANRSVSKRWFAGETNPPVPIPEPFARDKPANGFRVFVLGESTTAGFPYPHNGAFSRVIRDALHDVLPGDSVEVINLGIPAISSYALVDMANEIVAQHPDAVMIYAGHNEYYGTLGAASTNAVFAGHPSLVRAYLSVQRLRLVAAAKAVVERLRPRRAPADSQAVSFMETLAREQEIPLGGATYERGLRQFGENVGVLVRRFESARVPVFIASVVSNVADQPPLAAATNAARGGADSTFAEAKAALSRGDSATARQLFVRARDLDVVRFRAPSALNDTIRAIATSTGATYVPVAERFDQVSRGIPGSALFLEHVHPTEQGSVLIARTFIEALRDRGFLGRSAHMEHLRSWDAYRDRMALTPFDERTVFHTMQALTERWPFVLAAQQRDYRATYRPTGTLDSLSFLASRGLAWAPLKLQLARWYELAGHPDSAVAEYRGLVRDTPEFAEPWALLGQALMKTNADSEAAAAFNTSLQIRPLPNAELGAGLLAVKRRDPAAAVPLLERAAMATNRPDAWYELSLALALTHDAERARAAALRVAQIAPNYPGLADWLRTLGIGR
jgi:tetratricopeptide (TPR) repeat protein